MMMGDNLAALRAAKRSDIFGGVHFKKPWKLYPLMSASPNVYDSAGAGKTNAEVAFYTEMARRGIQDTTDWTANTYKTLLNVPAPAKGQVAAMCGPSAGGAETTTFEITVDGVLTEIAVGTLASTERAFLHCGNFVPSDLFTTAGVWLKPGTETLESDKATFGAAPADTYIAPWRYIPILGLPLLEFEQSLLIRAKHSVDITNSTATAYSFIMYRMGL